MSEKNNAAAGVSPAAVSFKTPLALFFGVGWGAVFCAVWADQLALTGFCAAGAVIGIGILLCLGVRYASKHLTPFLLLELLFLSFFCGLLWSGNIFRCLLTLSSFGVFAALFDGVAFAGYRKKFAVGALLGGAAAMQWEISSAPALIWLLMTTVCVLLFSSFRYKKRTAFSAILFLGLFFHAEHLRLDSRLMPQSIPERAQGISLIAAAGTPECDGEPRALCVTSDDCAAYVWESWQIFRRFETIRPGRMLPWGEKYDLIFCERLPLGAHFRPGVCLRRLAPGGVLALPVELAAFLPHLNWQVLPGSHGRFAAAKPDDPEWKIDADKLDASLFRGNGRKSDMMISPGALSGMLIGFRSQKAELPRRSHAEVFKVSGQWAWGVLLLFVLLHLAAFRRPKFSSALGIAENCFGFMLIFMLILKAFPACCDVLPVLVLFFLLYPVKIRNWLLKLIGTLAIAAALLWSLVPGIAFVAAALLLTGAEFSTTLHEQMTDGKGLAAVGAGLAFGALLAAFASGLPFAGVHVFQIALLFRVWTLIRC